MKATAACIVWICGAVSLALLLGCFHGSLSAGIAVAALIGALAPAILVYLQTSATPIRWNLWKGAAALAFILFSLRAFCWLIFFDEDQIKILSPNNLGDLALHITFVNYFANGASFWPANPIFPLERLHYPFAIDLFNALLVSAGADIYRSLVWVALLGALLTLVTLLRWGGGFAVAGFLFNGGLAGYKFFHHFTFADYQSEIVWKSIPLAIFVTQRGFLYAFPAGLLLLWSWRARFFGKENDTWSGLPFWAELLIYATMPIFHLHTFLFLSALLAFWAAAGRGILRKNALLLIAGALIPATTLVGFMTDWFHSRSSIHLMSLWMRTNSHFSWWMDFGFLIPFVALLFFQIARTRDKTAVFFLLPATLVSILGCFVVFTAWEWDNTKLFVWTYLVLLPFLWRDLIAAATDWVRAACGIVLFFSGAISLIGGIDRTHSGYDIAKRSELDAVAHAVETTSIEETFAAYPTFNHPLLLTGRKVALGYPGHLWSHGIAYQADEARLKSLMLGEPGWEQSARDLHVRYIFWGSREQAEYPGSTEPWKQSIAPAMSGKWGAIYRLPN